MGEYNFQKLTPKDDVELSIYEDALDFVFKNDDIKNIAISGAYSAGKSSILETYKKIKVETTFIHVSLAHFESSDEEKTFSEVPKENDSVGPKENNLEGKILNQLIHQIDIEKIPLTNFKVTRNLDSKEIKIRTVKTLIFMLLISYVTLFSTWKSFVDSISLDWVKNILSITTNVEFRLVIGIVLIVSVGLSLYSIIKALGSKNILKKVSFHGNEIEFFQGSDNSYFDKYLNEVLYLFENIEADVIVFEDMDRYNANQIFQKLREVNNLINQSRKKNKKTLRFFYLLRDDVFSSKDRTKFFDYIIPVVPVIDSSNSYNQFIQHFKSGGIFELFEASFLQEVSLYVDDMRMLKNVYNEFLIYNKQINTTEQNHNKLLALIIYKNIFPRDFSDLQLNKGFVNMLFANKDALMQQEISEIDSEIELLREKIERANSEHLRNDREVDTIYNPKIQNFRYRQEKKQEMEDEAKERKETIRNRADSGIELLANNINELKKEKHSIQQNEKLCQIINRNNIDEFFKTTYINEVGEETDFNEIKESYYFDLIKYLVRNGYIDETYPDYMTYFYENSLARIDKVFLRSVTDKRKKEYAYELKEPQMVVDRLSGVSFGDEEILNFDLFSILLSSSKNRRKLGLFIDQLRETNNLEFVKSFMETERNQEQFVKSMNLMWDDFFSIMLKEGDFSDQHLKVYSLFTLYFSNRKDIEIVNVENCLTDYISNNASYLDIDTPDVERLIKEFKLIGVCFESIEQQTVNQDLLAFVYEHNLYQITFENISLMLEDFYKLEETEEFHHKNYTLISSNPEAPLAKYMNENINEYMNIMLENCKDSVSDDAPVVLTILNNDEITLENKIVYIKVLTINIESLKEIDTVEIWELLLERKVITYSEDNILEYFFNSGKELDNTLIDFINSEVRNLDFSDLISNYGGNASLNFLKATIIANDLNNDKYKDIIKSLRKYYDVFEMEGISSDKIEILIDLKTVRMSEESLLFFRDHYTSSLCYFIEENINLYVAEIISEEIFDYDEMIDVISLEISDENKIALIKFTNEAISIVDGNYSDVVKVYILRNNLEVNDIPYLVTSYSQMSDSLKSEIELLTIEYKEKIIDDSIMLPIELFEVLLFSSNLDNGDRIEYFSIIIENLDREQTIKYLRILDLKNYEKLFERGRPKFEASAVNRRLLDAFKDKGWITKYEEDKEDVQYYRAFGKKMN